MGKNSLNNPEIERIIHFLEYEISSRHTKASRKGWTTSAILGAIASLLWLMFSILDTPTSISWRNILFIVLLLSISFDFLFLLNMLFFGESFHFLNENRFAYIDILTGKRIFLLLLRATLLLIIVIWLSPVLGQPVKLSCWGFFMFWFIVTIILMIYYFLKIPVPIGTQSSLKWVVNLYSIILVATGCIAIVGLVRIIYFNTLTLSLLEWRIGLILFSLSLLTLILLSLKPNPILISQLDDIRQRLAMGQIELNRAKEQIDLIIHGLTLSNVLQYKISDILVIIKTIQNMFNKIISKLAIVEKLFAQGEELTKEGYLTNYKTLSAIHKIQNEMESQYEMLRNKYSKLNRKVTFFYRGINKDINLNIENIFETIDTEYEKVNELRNALKARLDDLLDKMGEKMKKTDKKSHSQEIS